MLPSETDKQIKQRHSMVETQLRSRGITDQAVLKVMVELPRQFFIDHDKQYQAYDDNPVDIGQGQTISQPYIVALMTQALQLKKQHHILEIGTGCGYQTAILAKLAHTVYTVELRSSLAKKAQDRLNQLGITNIEYATGDGHNGWPRQKQFHRILVAAAPKKIPQKLIDQLEDGGKLVIPAGPLSSQKLLLLEKNNNIIEEKLLCYCRFVELVHNGVTI